MTKAQLIAIDGRTLPGAKAKAKKYPVHMLIA